MQGGALRLLLLYALLARVIPNPARFLTVLLVIGCGRFVHILAHLFADLLY